MVQPENHGADLAHLGGKLLPGIARWHRPVSLQKFCWGKILLPWGIPEALCVYMQIYSACATQANSAYKADLRHLPKLDLEHMQSEL